MDNKFVPVNFAIPSLIAFSLGGKKIGELVIENDRLKFVGNADESARIFFNDCLKPILDNYIREKIALLN